MYAHLQGRGGDAVERLQDLLHLGRTVRQDPFFMSQLVGMDAVVQAAQTAQQIAPTLAVDGVGVSGAATPAQVRALIAALLDEREARVLFARAMQAERASMLDRLAEKPARTWAIRPLADRSALRRLDGYAALVEAAGQRSYAAAVRSLGRVEAMEDGSGYLFWPGPSEPGAPRYSRWFDDVDPNDFFHYIESFFHHCSERRVSAVSLAAQLYRHDHGRWPDDLASLVPAYLDAVPTNPLLDGDKPLEYVVKRGALPDGGDRPLVFFEPVEGVVADVIDPEPMYGWQTSRARRGLKIRQYRDLALWLPTARRFYEDRRWLTEEAVEDDPEESDAPGDDAEQDGDADGPAKE